MLKRLKQPLWPQRALDLTTPLNLLLTVACVLGGLIVYFRGYTYEGSALAYMVAGIVFAYPYYHCRYTGYMTFLVLMCLVPQTIWLQNKAVEVGLWGYPPGKEYLIWITKAGEGYGHWTRHLWLGTDMPVMEYVFYPLFGFFQMTIYSVFSHVLPDHWFEEAQPRLKYLFGVVMIPVIALFIAVYFVFPNRNATDYSYWMIGMGFVMTVIGYFVSPNFRTYTQSPAFWIWMGVMSIGFMPIWEFFHSCINRDWIYNIQNTFPALYTFRRAPIPFTELFGYLTTATTFQALMLFFILRFGRIVVKEEQFVPFSKK